MNSQLSNDQLRQLVPAAFSDKPSPRMSDLYTFVPTYNVIDAMRKEGLVPVSASQSASRQYAHHKAFAKHMVRFRRAQDLVPKKSRKVGDEVPELVLLNSHDGTARYQLWGGLFRLVCLNGMVIPSMSFGGVNLLHKNRDDVIKDVIEASYTIIKDVPKLMGKVDKMKAVELKPVRQIAFGRSVIDAGLAPSWATPQQVIGAIRDEDGTDGQARSLWQVFNSAQEHVIKGGLVNESGGRRSRTREIKAPMDNIAANTELWTLAESFQR